MANAYETLTDPKDLRNNKLHSTDRAFHDWYRFVLSYPPHLVRAYIERFDLPKKSTILDPFCGTGTTIVEAKKNNFHAVGIEATPVSFLASSVKIDWSIDTDLLRASAEKIRSRADKKQNLSVKEYETLGEEKLALILKNSISELPLHKCLLLLKEIKKEKNVEVRNVFLLAFAYVAVHKASNLKFGPEVGVNRKKKEDASVIEDWHEKVEIMISDLEEVRFEKYPSAICFHRDSREAKSVLEPSSVDAIITSPPYPNEKDYTRTTRLESVLLGFVNDKHDLRAVKKGLLRSNTRNVYKADTDDLLIEPNGNVDRIAKEIERRRIALNKTSGFEKQYHRVTRLYFGGMKRHLLELQSALRPGAQLAYVVGDQASFLQVLIRTGELLAEIAEDIGYDVQNIDLFRTRVSTATGHQLREEALVLEWNPDKKKTINIDMASTKKKSNRYDKIIESVFFSHYVEGDDEFTFVREEFEDAAKELDIKLPKNLGDIIYSYRYRNPLPAKIVELLGEGEEWIIRSVGKGRYSFAKSKIHRIEPNPRLSKIKIPDSTPEVIRRYALNDEQALLAILRYNRLLDIFSGVTCYSLQNHLRTTVKEIGQIETDEIYIGLNDRGQQYVLPVQAKGKTDQLGIVQIEQDFALCKAKFPNLLCRPIAAQFIEENLIALFEFEKSVDGITIRNERHYKIVGNDNLSDEEIREYNVLAE